LKTPLEAPKTALWCNCAYEQPALSANFCRGKTTEKPKNTRRMFASRKLIESGEQLQLQMPGEISLR